MNPLGNLWDEQMNINNVFIVGAGLMGSGLAQVCAQQGLSVTLCDNSQKSLDRAHDSIAWSVGKLVHKGKVSGTVEQIVGRIAATTNFDAATQADLVLEAVFEDLEVKRDVLRSVDSRAPAHALLASNTSAIPITDLAACTGRPERVLGLHFFSPVPMMRAVEVVRGVATSDETMDRGKAFVEHLGKEPILVQMDLPGFLINRINLPSNLEAMRMVERGVGTPEDIDKGMRLATGRRMGPFETGDMVGLDVTFGALMALYNETGDARWYPPMILRRKVKAGHLGRKTCRGWYRYDDDGKPIKG